MPLLIRKMAHIKNNNMKAGKEARQNFDVDVSSMTSTEQMIFQSETADFMSGVNEVQHY